MAATVRYRPCMGLQAAIMLEGENACVVRSATERFLKWVKYFMRSRHDSCKLINTKRQNGL